MGRFLASLLSDLCAAEIAAWLPWIALKITQVAVRALPEAQRERYDEEWRGHLSEIPGALTKLGIACGFLCAAIKIWPRRTRTPEIAFYWLLVPLLVMKVLAMCAMAAVWAPRARCRYTVPLELDLGNRDVQITIDRIPLGLALRLALSPRVSLEFLNRCPCHYSIWCPPSRSAGLEDFISTRVLGWDPHLRFGMKINPLPAHWRNMKIH